MGKEILRRKEQCRFGVGLVLAFIMALVIFLSFQIGSPIGYFISIAVSIVAVKAIDKLTNFSSK